MDCIVNVTENWGIGLQGALLVSISADLRRFRQLTTGKTVILGRKTLATFPGGRPLKDRVNLVLTHDKELEIPGAVMVRSREELRHACRAYPSENLCVIGGASIYELLLPCCSRALVTKTLACPPADRFFPNLDRLPNWSCKECSEILEENGVRFQYVEYANAAPEPI